MGFPVFLFISVGFYSLASLACHFYLCLSDNHNCATKQKICRDQLNLLKHCLEISWFAFMASFYRNLWSPQHSICSGMEQKKTALSAGLRNMDTWQQQWEEGCLGGLNTTPHLSLGVRAFLHFFPPVSVETPPSSTAKTKSRGRNRKCLDRFESLLHDFITVVKIRQSAKTRFRGHMAETDVCREKSFGEKTLSSHHSKVCY